MLNKFSRVMFGTKIFMELLNEIASINNLNEFLIIINHDNYNYRIKALYSNDLKKINYPKRFRKTVYNAEPTSNVIMSCNDIDSEHYDDEYEAFEYRRDWSGCLCYHIKIINNTVNMSQDNESLKLINKDLLIKEMEEGKTTKFVMNYKFNKQINSIIYNY